MKMKVRSIACAVLLAPAILFADSINVTFDAALTNTAEWAYSDDVKISADSDKHIFFNTLRSFIQSPEYPFIITSIELTLSCSNTNATRRLQVSPSTGTSLQTANVTSKDKKEVQSFLFDSADCVRSFNISLEGSGQTGNWHIYSAAIFGVPLIEAPTNLQADDSKGTRCRLSWANPVNAVSNKIEVSEVVRKVVYGTMLDEYDFMAFTNKSSSVTEHYDKQSLQVNDYPSFSGTNIYKAASNSTGVVQISNGKSLGYLKYDFSAIRDSLDEAADISLHISAKKHNTDISTINWKLLVAQINNNNTTNKTDEIDLTGDFPSSPFTIQVVQPNSCRAIVMRPSDETQGNRRILIDYLAFINVGPTTICETNLVITAFATNSTTYCVRELNPRTQYIASTIAFDEDGNESEPSELISFMTGSEELPFIIRLQ
jgi:hypothetical protein